MTQPVEGDVLDGRFRLERQIGEGGFAVVWVADDLGSGKRVAVKLLKADAGRSMRPDDVRRFEREIRALAQLGSNHIVDLITSGSGNGTPYAAFEYLEGVELRQLLRDRGRLEPAEVEHVLRQLLGALGEAHRHGLLHRDIKPENIFVVPRPDDPLFVKLIDFGIARALDDGSPQITKSGELIGTPRYMAPEQLTQNPLTPASDLYSLGIVAIEMAAGTEALHGGAWSDQLERLVTQHEFDMHGLARLGPRLRQVIGRMSARAPADRFSSAAAALAALDGTSVGPRAVPAARTRAPRMFHWALAGVALFGIAAVVLGYIDKSEPEVVPLPPAPAVVEGLIAGDGSPPVEETDEDSDLGRAAPSSPLCDPLPSGGEHGVDRHHVTLVHAASGLTASQVRRVIVLLKDGSGLSRADALDYFDLTERAEANGTLLLVPATKLDDAGRSWDAANLVGIAVRVSVLLDSWCIGDDVPLFFVGEGSGAVGIDRWLCLGDDVRKPDAVVVSAHRYTVGTRLDCPNWTRRPYMQFVQARNRDQPPDGGPQCGDRTTPVVSAAEHEARLIRRQGCDGPSSGRIEETDGACEKWDCGYTRCEIAGGRDWPGGKFVRDPDDLSLGCIGEPADFPYRRVMWGFFERHGRDAE